MTSVQTCLSVLSVFRTIIAELASEGLPKPNGLVADDELGRAVVQGGGPNDDDDERQQVFDAAPGELADRPYVRETGKPWASHPRMHSKTQHACSRPALPM